MVRSAPFIQFPSNGISVGESGSDGFQTGVPFIRNSVIFCDEGVAFQYAKNRLMVIVPPLPFVICMASCCEPDVTRVPDTVVQLATLGASGVTVPVSVGVNVLVGVLVGGRGVFVRVRVGRGVLVLVAVGTGVGVSVLGKSVPGRTTTVNVGGTVGEGVLVIPTGVGVKVMAFSISNCACSGEIVAISAGEQ